MNAPGRFCSIDKLKVELETLLHLDEVLIIFHQV